MHLSLPRMLPRSWGSFWGELGFFKVSDGVRVWQRHVCGLLRALPAGA
jgi:hypothetical protein